VKSFDDTQWEEENLHKQGEIHSLKQITGVEHELTPLKKVDF